MPNTSTFHRLAAGALLVGLVAGTAACGDDDGDAAAATTTPRAGVLDPAACDAYVELGAAFAQAPQDPAELQAFGESLVPTVDALANALPGELASDAETLRAAIEAVAETGDPSGVFSPDGMAAQAAIGAAAHDGCEAEKVDVVARDFAFDGVADELAAGRVSFSFANEGTEEHEMIVLRRNDGSEATLEELSSRGPDALFEHATFTGVVFAPPSATSYTAMDLEPGTYFLLCTIPTGGAPDAEPHAAHGMQQTVEVLSH